MYSFGHLLFEMTFAAELRVPTCDTFPANCPAELRMYRSRAEDFRAECRNHVYKNHLGNHILCATGSIRYIMAKYNQFGVRVSMYSISIYTIPQNSAITEYHTELKIGSGSVERQCLVWYITEKPICHTCISIRVELTFSECRISVFEGRISIC